MVSFSVKLSRSPPSRGPLCQAVTECWLDVNSPACIAAKVFKSGVEVPPGHVWSGDSGNWIEIAYGTSSGTVRVIVQHPETVGSGPQLFQTFSVHRSPVTKIMLSEKHLISGELQQKHRRITSPQVSFIKLQSG